MCAIVDEYANKVNENTLEASLRSLFENGGSFELALKAFSQASEDVISKIYEETMSSLQTVS